MRAVLLILLGFLLSCKQSLTTLPMSQGFTTTEATQIAVLVKKNTQYKYLVLDSSQLRLLKSQLQSKMWSDEELESFLKTIKNSVSVLVSKKISRRFSKQSIETLFIKGLSLKKTYNLIVVGRKKCKTGDTKCIKKCGSFCNVLVDKREFKTLDINNKEVKMAVASCSATYLYDVQRRIWSEVLQHKPDVILLIGDNLYVDRYINGNSVSHKKDFWTRYVEMRKSLKLYQAKKLVPIFATWDDHDYGTNDGDASFRWKKEAKKVFQSFFAQKPMGSIFQKGPGISFVVQAFGQRLFFMDNRFFRTPNVNDKRNKLRLKNVKYETHWGKKQERWLFSQLQNSSTPSWLIDGGQFFGGYLPWESYEASHPTNFKKTFIPNMKKSKSAVAFLSGDRHFFEFMKIPKQELGFSTYEITTSGIHTRLYPSLWVKYFNKRQVFGKAMIYNYAIINSKAVNETTKQDSETTKQNSETAKQASETTKQGLSVSLEAWELGRKLVYRKSFKVFR